MRVLIVEDDSSTAKSIELMLKSENFIVDATDLASREASMVVARNEVAELTIRTRTPIAVDRHRDFEVTGRFVLVDEYDVAGGGIITEVDADLARAVTNGFAGGTAAQARPRSDEASARACA